MKYHSLYTLLVYWKPYNIRRLGWPSSVTLTKTWRRTFRIHAIKASRKEPSTLISYCWISDTHFTLNIVMNTCYSIDQVFFFLSTCWFFLWKAIRILFNSHWNNCSQTPTTLFTHLAKEDVSAVSLYVRELFLHQIFHVVASPSILI